MIFLNIIVTTILQIAGILSLVKLAIMFIILITNITRSFVVYIPILVNCTLLNDFHL